MSAAADLASGKDNKQENFPVASWLVAPEYRAPILAFYRFARAADDVADHPTATPAEKYARLDALEASLTGADRAEPAGAALRSALRDRGMSDRHPRDLLRAFRQDVGKRRYANWDELYDYCRWSAMPVGRFVLDVHGESHATWARSDALCAALQIVNHLQDCGKDFRTLDRVYLPLDRLAAGGAQVGDLRGAHATPALRAVVAALADRCLLLFGESASFADAIRDRRLAAEVAVIQRLGVSLARRLRTRDPLRQRVHHGKAEALLLAAAAAVPRLLRR